LGGLCSDGEPSKKASTLLPGYDRDTRFVPTIVMRRAGGVLQRYGRQDILRCVRTVRTSVTRRVHCVGRDEAVGRLSTVSMRVKEGASSAEESFHLDVETHQSTTPMPGVYSTPPQKSKNKVKT